MYYILFTLNSFYFRLYTINIFKNLMVCVKVKIYCALARNLALLAILIFTQLINAILYGRYNSKYTAVTEDQAGRTFLYTPGPLLTSWSRPISGSISGRPLIRVYPQLGGGGAMDILKYWWLAG